MKSVQDPKNATIQNKENIWTKQKIIVKLSYENYPQGGRSGAVLTVPRESK